MLRAAQPGMKLVVMMRDPVERLHSAFWYYGCMHGVGAKGGLDADAFHAAAERQVAAVRQCMQEGASARLCARQSWGAAEQVVKGMYAAFAPDWLAVYPEEQIMWIRAEDYYANERLHLEVRAPCAVGIFGDASGAADCRRRKAAGCSRSKRECLAFVVSAG